MQKYLTKSDLRLYLDSPRHLWAKLHDAYHPELTDFDQKTTADGYRVEKLAIKYLECYHITGGKILQTQRTFTDNIFLARIDALIYDPETDTYDLYEIKSSTYDENEPAIDKTHLYDITFQSIILDKQITIKHRYLLFLNANYRRKGDLNLNLLFRPVEVSPEIIEKTPDILNFRQDMQRIANLESPAGLEACFSPKKCGCKDICHPNLPEHNIYELLARSRRKLAELRNANILAISNIPPDFELGGQAKLYYEVYRGPERIINHNEIKQILDTYKYPIYFLDYETISDPIPQFDGIKPYQNLATQYSLHIAHADGSIDHHEYIYEGQDCPLKYTVTDMLAHIGDTGTVLAWNDTFEKNVNQKAAESYPDLADQLEKVNDRIKDLTDSFKNLHYLDKNFHCSWSIKKVLPVMCPECSYKALPINHGDQASAEWLRMNSDATPPEEKATIKKNLLRYCELDTWAMVRIWQELKKESGLN